MKYLQNFEIMQLSNDIS